MTRWTAIVLVLCLTTPLLAQGKAKGRVKKKKEAAAAAAAAAAGEKEDESRVILAFDPGSHTRPVSALGFNRDQSRLITVGWDYTVQVWSTATGERLDILRLPAFGRDNGFDSNRWEHAAVSADGALVAIGGGPKLLFGDHGIPTRLLIVDLARRQVRKVLLPADPQSPVTCLGFSATGDRLAVGLGGADNSVCILDDVLQLVQNAADAKPASEPALVVKGKAKEPHQLALSRTGNKLVVAESSGLIAAFDVTGKASENWRQLGAFEHGGTNDALEWAPDESHFAWSWRRNQEYSLELRTPDTKLLRHWDYGELSTAGFGRSARAATLRYLDASRLFIAAGGANPMKGEGAGGFGVILNPQTGKTNRSFFEEQEGGTCRPFGAASPGGTLAATVTQRGLEVAIYSLEKGEVVARCGSRTPVPTIVGWSREAKSPMIAWSDKAPLRPWNSKPEDLEHAFDLDRLVPVAGVVPANFQFRTFSLGEWKLTWSDTRSNYLDVRLQQGDRDACDLKRSRAMTLIANGENPPLVAHSVHDLLNNTGSFAYLRDATGKLVCELLPAATQHQDMASSPDGRYLLVSTGTHRLSLYRTDGSRFPFLNFVRTNGEWVCWMPEGYYAASPGGEKMIGWAESRGSSEFPLFHPAEKFAKQFHRPDIIRLALEKGSLSLALESLKTEIRAVEEILPPRCELQKLGQTGGRVQVRAVASASPSGKPVVSMRLLLDGRPLSGGVAQKSPAAGQNAEATWEIDVPAGSHELKLLARNEDSSAVSSPLNVTGPKAAGQQPVLHRLCVGINEYQLSALNLGSAAKDATDVFAALEQNCVGPQNRFGAAKGVVLTDRQATRSAVLKAIGETRKAAKPGDLVVFLFAGHGINQQEEFYLMTHEADPGSSLKGKSLSGEDLRQALADMECPVLLLMDACHSARGVKAFRPATDDLARSLTDDAAGVTVLAAAMAHEVASATEENGYFTAALLKALQLGKDVPYDPYEHVLYTHHIYSVVFSEVRRATNGRQNPFLNMPWTVPPLVLRDVPEE